MGNDGLFYTSQDLEYIYFVHSLCLLGRVLLYSGGRDLFPVVLPDTEGNFPLSCKSNLKINSFLINLQNFVGLCTIWREQFTDISDKRSFKSQHQTTNDWEFIVICVSETVTISSLLVALIRIMCTALPSSGTKPVLDGKYLLDFPSCSS